MRVDFYLLESNAHEPLHLCARLCARAFDEGLRPLIRAADTGTARALDALLWRVPAGRFLPHGIVGDAAAERAPIRITTGDEAAALIVNLSGRTVHGALPAGARILEIVAADEEALSAARERFRDYRQAGAELHTHKL